MSKMDCQLLHQKVCQRISVIPENWNFSSRFVLKTTKTPVFAFTTEILWRTFLRNKWQSIFDVVKDFSFCLQFYWRNHKCKLLLDISLISYLFLDKGWVKVIEYLLDVLCRQPIKLFQVVSTSEFHEY